jgi:hypothetical protein
VPALPTSANHYYRWSNGQLGSSIILDGSGGTGNIEGRYTVQIMNNGCKQEITQRVEAADFGATSPAATTAYTQPSCASANGSITVTPATTTISNLFLQPYSQGNSISDLSAGVYYSKLYFTGSGANNCTSILTHNLSNSGTSPATTPAITNAGCFGSNTGSITLTGASGYAYGWNNGATGISISNIPAGTYTLHGVNGTCHTYQSFTIEQNQEVTQVVTSNLSACSTSNAQINISQISPIGTTYWYNGTTLNSTNFGYRLNGVNAGTYPILAVSANCSTITNIVLHPIAPLTAQTTVTQSSCQEGNDAEIALHITGGTPMAASGINYTTYNVVMNPGNILLNSNNVKNLEDATPYSFLITDNRGCTTVANVTPQSTNTCGCLGQGYTMVNRNNNIINAQNLGTFLAANTTYYCTSDIIFDVPYTGNSINFDENTFIMSPGTKMVFTDGTGLRTPSENNNIFRGCDGLWDGIYFKGRGNDAILYHITLQDATNGLVLTDGGRLGIYGSMFYNNKKSIQIFNLDDILVSRQPAFAYVIGGNNTFSCPATPHAWQVTQSDQQISFNNCRNVFIRPRQLSNGTFEAHNTISDAVIGIDIKESDLGLYGTDFSNINRGATPASHAGGVYCDRNPSRSYFLNIGSALPKHAVSFTDCSRGILEYNRDFNVTSTSFSLCDNAIAGAFNIGKTISITDNQMDFVGSGISLNASVNSGINIKNNSITTVNPNYQKEFGILNLDHANAGNHLSITANAITTGGYAGIHVSNNGYGNIDQNNILNARNINHQSTHKYAGILLQNNVKMTVSCNQNYITQGAWSLGNFTNITNAYSTDMTLQCNNNWNARQGIQFTGNSLGSKILGNQFRGSFYGLVLGEQVGSNLYGGTLGPQQLNNQNNTPGNKYLGYDNNGTFYGAAILSINSYAANNAFWVNNGIYNPLTNNAIGLATAFLPNNQPAYVPFACPRECENDIPWDEASLEGLEQFSEQLSTQPNDEALYQWLQEKELLKKIKEDPTLLTSAILNDFYQDQMNSDKEKLAETQVAVSFITDESSGAITPEIRLMRINEAKEKLAEVNPIEIYAINEKKVTETKLNLWGEERTILTQQEYDENLAIANMCPYIGGPSVYEARAIVYSQNQELIFDDQLFCANVAMRKRKIDSTSYFDGGLKVFPNPASTVLNIQNLNSEVLQIEIKNQLGNIVVQEKVVDNKINVESLSNGLYLYIVKSNDVVKAIGKISIIH